MLLCAKRLAAAHDICATQKVLLSIAEKVARLGWHTIVYLEAQNLGNLSQFLRRLPTTVVINHMGCVDVRNGRQSRRFRPIPCHS
jgi:2-pyrone-4,6-dicarboxylate lactonase